MSKASEGPLEDQAAIELEDAGWPEVAADVRDGVPLATILRRLYEMSEGNSNAAEIVEAALEGQL